MGLCPIFHVLGPQSTTSGANSKHPHARVQSVATTAPTTDRVCGSLLIKRFPSVNPQYCWTAEVIQRIGIPRCTHVHLHSPSVCSSVSKRMAVPYAETLIEKQVWALRHSSVHPLVGLSQQYATQPRIVNKVLTLRSLAHSANHRVLFLP